MKTDYEALFQDPLFRKELAIEAFVLDASEVIARAMKEQRVSRAELARRMGKSRAWITQVLSGRANLTLRTLAEIAWSLGVELKLQETASTESRTLVAADLWRYDTQSSAKPEPVSERGVSSWPFESLPESQEYAA